MAQDDGIAVGRRGAKRTLAQPPDLGSHACGYRRCAAPRGGVMSALGRPGGAHAAPTLAAIAAALRAALMRPPRSRLSPLRCPPRGSNERLGAALRRSCGPHARGYRRCAAPRGGAMSGLGRPCDAHAAPPLAAIAAALPPKGGVMSALGRPGDA